MEILKVRGNYFRTFKRYFTTLSCWEKGPTNLGVEESETAFSGDSDPENGELPGIPI